MAAPESPAVHGTARRILAVLIGVFAAGMLSVILHGILSTLLGDTPPAPGEGEPRIEVCTRDLTRLELRFRERLAKSFGEPPEADEREWLELMRPLQRELDSLRLRCRLERAERPAHLALARAAMEFEAAMQATGLLWDRHRADGRLRLRAARDALQEARRLAEGTETSTGS